MIAIENVRLFDEVQARTHDLTEALQQQTATAEVLKVISRSAFDLDAVLKTLTNSARSLSGAATAAVLLRDGDVFRFGANRGRSGVLQFRTPIPLAPARRPSSDAWSMTGEAVQIPDVRGPRLRLWRGRRSATIAQFAAPLMRDGEVDGVFGLIRPEPGAFTPRQIETGRDFRRPGGDRDRERAPVRRGAGAHPRPHGSAGAADRNQRSAVGDQPLAD